MCEPFGMMTCDQSLVRSYDNGIITEETAVAYATRRAVAQRGVDTIKQKRGERTTPIDGLKLDWEYGRGIAKR